MPRADEYMPRILKHEGGFVNHPADPGGATNRGVTIGTLRKLGIDKDGDGDSDLADLKALTEADAAKVFKRFYADAVQADLLPRGVDYAVTDFAVNSGPVRAAQHLQRALGVEADGHIGPKTIAAAAKADPAKVIEAVCASRLAFMRQLSAWATFGKGWSARVAECRRLALGDLIAAPAPEKPPVAASAPENVSAPPAPATGLLAAILALLARIFGKAK